MSSTDLDTWILGKGSHSILLLGPNVVSRAPNDKNRNAVIAPDWIFENVLVS